LVKTVDLDPSKNYLFASHPHGILCSGAFSSFATESHEVEKVFPGLSFSVLTLEMNFKFPILRDLLLSLGTKLKRTENVGSSSDNYIHIDFYFNLKGCVLPPEEA
jgi:hypothetical protein